MYRNPDQIKGPVPKRQYPVPLIAQEKEYGCWAASMAMILSWKHQKMFTPAQVAQKVGYEKMREQGLHPEDTKAFKDWGFTWLYPQSFMVAGFAELIRQHGPIWVATAVPTPHVRVVTGFEAHPDPARALVYINDPGPVHKGSVYIETYETFSTKKNTLASKELLGDFPDALYTAYL